MEGSVVRRRLYWDSPVQNSNLHLDAPASEWESADEQAGWEMAGVTAALTGDATAASKEGETAE
jgi:hypothetical protein